METQFNFDAGGFRHAFQRSQVLLEVFPAFGFEIDTCARCGGTLKIIANIEAPAVIARILSHLDRTAPEQYEPDLPLGARALPARSRPQ